MFKFFFTGAILSGLLNTAIALAEPQPRPGGTMQLTSPAFTQGQPIPRKYTCDGNDISPPLAWSNAPQGTQSFALIMDDPDAPGRTWVHWVMWNIPASARALPENVPPLRETHGRQPARQQHLAEDRLRRPLPAIRHAPLFLQAVCAGYDVELSAGCRQGTAARRNERASAG